MDFINENNGPVPGCAGACRFHHDDLDLFDAAQYGAEIHKIAAGASRDDLRQGCFADSGRSPEDH
jgi:hypothetical protein